MSGPARGMPELGVCSWSLRPASPEELAERVRDVGVKCVQLALDPIRTGAWDEALTVRVLRDAGIAIVSGMMGMEGEDYTTLESIRITGGVRPDATWSRNRHAAAENAALARRLGLELVTFHAGFLPHDPRDAERRAMIERLAELAHVFGAQGVQVGFETGQETAATLLEVLGQMPAGVGGRVGVGVNFDPANMILYGMGDPVEALRRLAGHTLQIHVKDARATRTPGQWGEEVPVGTGEVAWREFFAAYRDAGLQCRLLIEREAGTQRVADARRAAEVVRGIFARAGDAS